MRSYTARPSLVSYDAATIGVSLTYSVGFEIVEQSSNAFRRPIVGSGGHFVDSSASVLKHWPSVGKQGLPRVEMKGETPT